MLAKDNPMPISGLDETLINNIRESSYIDCANKIHKAKISIDKFFLATISIYKAILAGPGSSIDKETSRQQNIAKMLEVRKENYNFLGDGAPALQNLKKLLYTHISRSQDPDKLIELANTYLKIYYNEGKNEKHLMPIHSSFHKAYLILQNQVLIDGNDLENLKKLLEKLQEQPDNLPDSNPNLLAQPKDENELNTSMYRTKLELKNLDIQRDIEKILSAREKIANQYKTLSDDIIIIRLTTDIKYFTDSQLEQKQNLIRKLEKSKSDYIKEQYPELYLLEQISTELNQKILKIESLNAQKDKPIAEIANEITTLTNFLQQLEGSSIRRSTLGIDFKKELFAIITELKNSTTSSSNTVNHDSKISSLESAISSKQKKLKKLKNQLQIIDESKEYIKITQLKNLITKLKEQINLKEMHKLLKFQEDYFKLIGPNSTSLKKLSDLRNYCSINALTSIRFLAITSDAINAHIQEMVKYFRPNASFLEIAFKIYNINILSDPSMSGSRLISANAEKIILAQIRPLIVQGLDPEKYFDNFVQAIKNLSAQYLNANDNTNLYYLNVVTLKILHENFTNPLTFQNDLSKFAQLDTLNPITAKEHVRAGIKVLKQKDTTSENYQKRLEEYINSMPKDTKINFKLVEKTLFRYGKAKFKPQDMLHSILNVLKTNPQSKKLQSDLTYIIYQWMTMNFENRDMYFAFETFNESDTTKIQSSLTTISAGFMQDKRIEDFKEIKEFFHIFFESFERPNKTIPEFSILEQTDRPPNPNLTTQIVADLPDVNLVSYQELANLAEKADPKEIYYFATMAIFKAISAGPKTLSTDENKRKQIINNMILLRCKNPKTFPINKSLAKILAIQYRMLINSPDPLTFMELAKVHENLYNNEPRQPEYSQLRLYMLCEAYSILQNRIKIDLNDYDNLQKLSQPEIVQHIQTLDLNLFIEIKENLSQLIPPKDLLIKKLIELRNKCASGALSAIKLLAKDSLNQNYSEILKYYKLDASFLAEASKLVGQGLSTLLPDSHHTNPTSANDNFSIMDPDLLAVLPTFQRIILDFIENIFPPIINKILHDDFTAAINQFHQKIIALSYFTRVYNLNYFNDQFKLSINNTHSNLNKFYLYIMALEVMDPKNVSQFITENPGSINPEKSDIIERSREDFESLQLEYAESALTILKSLANDTCLNLHQLINILKSRSNSISGFSAKINHIIFQTNLTESINPSTHEEEIRKFLYLAINTSNSPEDCLNSFAKIISDLIDKNQNNPQNLFNTCIVALKILNENFKNIYIINEELINFQKAIAAQPKSNNELPTISEETASELVISIFISRNQNFKTSDKSPTSISTDNPIKLIHLTPARPKKPKSEHKPTSAHVNPIQINIATEQTAESSTDSRPNPILASSTIDPAPKKRPVGGFSLFGNFNPANAKGLLRSRANSCLVDTTDKSAPSLE